MIKCSELQKVILKILEENKKPLKAREIARIIEKKDLDISISKKEVNKILWNELNSEVVYDSKNYKYSLKSTQTSLFAPPNSSEKDWKISVISNLEKPIKIDYINKELIFRQSSQDLNYHFMNFIENLFRERTNHRSPKIDLFFENFEEFYTEN